MRLHQKTALITGGTDGIGLATAKLFVKEGARVAVTGRDKNRIEKAKLELGANSLVIAADVRSHDEMAMVSRRIQEEFTALDVLFANAGRAFDTPLESTTEEQYDEMIDTNLKGVFFTMQTALPVMREGASVILNTSFINQTGKLGLSLCAASKAAVRSLAQTWSKELLARKIRVNAVSPGIINTDIIAKMGLSPEEVEKAKSQFSTLIPVGYMGKPDDIAAATLFLASDESKYVVGTELVVDGGISQL
ncbi:SDR family oxidoreductase [Blastopirellula marina]|uniref:Short-chain dehydrogenase/reductase SDR n=1 Tax=Blastopirellula marina DSM 3645 TaxID=314230 RepID=A4A177_9BACT|nr:SDR family oxidoreductase [Blastopirellula marina]EAQ77429.1 Short-chain dehydrogenase/reductase SDR [Blastopirellula marina DSM 3645]